MIFYLELVLDSQKLAEIIEELIREEKISGDEIVF